MREIIYNPRTRRWHIIDRVHARRARGLAELLLIFLLPPVCCAMVVLLYKYGPAIDLFFTNLLKAILSTNN